MNYFPFNRQNPDFNAILTQILDIGINRESLEIQWFIESLIFDRFGGKSWKKSKKLINISSEELLFQKVFNV